MPDDLGVAGDAAAFALETGESLREGKAERFGCFSAGLCRLGSKGSDARSGDRLSDSEGEGEAINLRMRITV